MSDKKSKGLGQWFTRITRGKGEDAERIWTLKDSHPEWLQETVQEAHQTDFPNDWIYYVCAEACEAIDDGALSDDDSVHEWADGMVDIYTKALYQWQADMCLSYTYANAESEVDDLGGTEKGERRVAAIQYFAIRTIALTMLEASREHADSDQGEREASHEAS